MDGLGPSAETTIYQSAKIVKTTRDGVPMILGETPDQVVSIDLFLVFFVPFSYNGVY